MFSKVNYTALSKCRVEMPVPAVQYSCDKLAILCREIGHSESTIELGCIDKLIKMQNISAGLLPFQDPEIAITCANTRFKEKVSEKERNLTASCSTIFNMCRAVSNRNDYWSYNYCYSDIQRGIPSDMLSKVNQTAHMQCRNEMPIVELQNPCGMFKVYCRELGYLEDIGATCIMPYVQRIKTFLLPQHDRALPSKCANYQNAIAIKNEMGKFSAACTPIFDVCKTLSEKSFDWLKASTRHFQ